MSNKTLFVIHRWIGLNCGVVLFVICLSGTVATLSEEIDWLINPTLRVSPTGQPLAWSELQQRVESQHPDLFVRTIRAPRNERTATFVEVESDTGQDATLLVNSYSGEVQGVYWTHCVKVLFRIFHKQFYIYGYPKGVHGVYIVGTYGLVLLVAGLTGLLFYKRFWGRLFVLRWRRGWDVFWRDSHRLLGVWTAILLFVWSITGIWYLAERILTQTSLVDSSPSRLSIPKRDTTEASLSVGGPTVSELTVEDYLRIAEQEFPDFRVTTLHLPRKAGGPASLLGATNAALVRENTSQIVIDSVTGEIIAHRRAEDLGVFDRWAVTADPVHFGNFGGLPTKILWFVLGLGVSALIPFGATIWYRRTSMSATLSQATGTRRTACAKIASIVWTSLILALAAGYSYAKSPPRMEKERKPVPVAELGVVEIGPWTGELARLGSMSPGEQVTFRIRFPQSSLPNIKRATVELGGKKGTFSGPWNLYRARLRLPENSVAFDDLVLVLEGRDGNVYRQRISSEDWTKPAEIKTASLPTGKASPLATGVFLAFFAFVGVFTAVWFWKIG